MPHRVDPAAMASTPTWLLPDPARQRHHHDLSESAAAAVAIQCFPFAGAHSIDPPNVSTVARGGAEISGDGGMRGCGAADSSMVGIEWSGVSGGRRSHYRLGCPDRKGHVVPTPHISADKDAFAEAILLPGDPLRAKYIAERFLDGAEQVTAVRNMLGFTGTYQGMRVSVMGTGMGIPSASIYATELVREYGVEKLVRVGSCGGIGSAVQMRDVIIATGACTDSGVNRNRYGGWDFAAVADFGLVRAAVEAATGHGAAFKVGLIHSADLFYNPRPDAFEVMERMGVLAVEMEAAGLYGVAAEEKAKALTIATVSDHIGTGESTSSDERERTFNDMVTIALDALKLDAA